MDFKDINQKIIVQTSLFGVFMGIFSRNLISCNLLFIQDFTLNITRNNRTNLKINFWCFIRNMFSKIN